MPKEELCALEVVAYGEPSNSHFYSGPRARSELKIRLRRAVNQSPSGRREIIRKVLAKEPVRVTNIRGEHLVELHQILEVMGAVVRTEH